MTHSPDHAERTILSEIVRRGGTMDTSTPQMMTLAEAQAFAERLADRDPNKMEFIGSRRWDAYRYVVPAVIAGLGLLKPEVDADVLAVRKMLHAYQRAMTPPDSGWGNMSYLKGSYDDTDTFKAALAAYRSTPPGASPCRRMR